jgi:hypothetical protein
MVADYGYSALMERGGACEFLGVGPGEWLPISKAMSSRDMSAIAVTGQLISSRGYGIVRNNQKDVMCLQLCFPYRKLHSPISSTFKDEAFLQSSNLRSSIIGLPSGTPRRCLRRIDHRCSRRLLVSRRRAPQMKS